MARELPSASPAIADMTCHHVCTTSPAAFPGTKHRLRNVKARAAIGTRTDRLGAGRSSTASEAVVAQTIQLGVGGDDLRMRFRAVQAYVDVDLIAVPFSVSGLALHGSRVWEW